MISFPSRPPCLSCIISLVAPWNHFSWVRILYRCILMHSFVVKSVFLLLVLTRLSPCQLVSLLLTMLSSIGITYWYHSLSSPWVVTSFVIICFFSELVNPFAWCVWEGRVLHRVSHLFKTMLMLHAHPYNQSSQVFCHDSHTSFWLSPFLSYLSFLLLNHVFVTSARLSFLFAHLHLLCVSIDFDVVMILFCARCIQIQN